jgi:hypothetical protein
MPGCSDSGTRNVLDKGFGTGCLAILTWEDKTLKTGHGRISSWRDVAAEGLGPNKERMRLSVGLLAM